MKPLHYEAICKMLLERFGEPIGDREAAPTSNKKKDMGNRGFGSAKLDESGCCEQCGMMAGGMEQGHSCGMDEVDAFDGPRDTDVLWAKADEIIARYGDADMSAEEMLELLLQNDIPKDIALDMVESVRGERLDEEEELDEKTPPGGEKVVKALKKDKKVKNPWAVAWAMKNKGEI